MELDEDPAKSLNIRKCASHLGFSLVSFLLHEEQDGDGTPNPLMEAGPGLQKAYAWGRSQSGRFLREFVYRGFNEDARGRRVFDAVSPHVAGCGRVALNYRFAQPGRVPYHHASHMYPSDQFPFAYSVTTDPFTCTADAILTRPDTDPLVIHTQTSSEYWERRGSLVHTDCLGNDLAEHERARVYLFSSGQHHPNSVEEPRPGAYRHTRNPLDTRPVLRALLDALDAWATDGTPPPASPPSHPGGRDRGARECRGDPLSFNSGCRLSRRAKPSVRPGPRSRFRLRPHGQGASRRA